MPTRLYSNVSQCLNAECNGTILQSLWAKRKQHGAIAIQKSNSHSIMGPLEYAHLPYLTHLSAISSDLAD
jgi:hypothetical protein